MFQDLLSVFKVLRSYERFVQVLEEICRGHFLINPQVLEVAPGIPENILWVLERFKFLVFGVLERLQWFFKDA